MKDEIVYIAGKYRGKTPAETRLNIAFASIYAFKYWKMGYPTICPHMNTAFFDSNQNQISENNFVDGDLKIVERCDILVLIPRWEDSVGATKEMVIAKLARLKIIYEDDLDNKIKEIIDGETNK